jgi:pimeloyl-ACP methyl ester carboxylesterase
MPATELRFKTSHADIALSQSAGAGLPIVMLHGNSCNRKVFDAQMESAIGEAHRLIAIDLPGHGESTNAFDPERTYTLPGYAQVVVETLGELGIDRAAVFGWSLGGHVALEMVEHFDGMVGLMVTGTPPVGRAPEAIQAGFQPTPHIGLAGKPEFTEEDAAIFAFACYGDPASPAAHEAFARADGNARAVMFASMFAGKAADERRIAETSRLPLAIVNGQNDPLVSLEYIAGLDYANLWDQHCFVLRDAGHAPFMQVPDVFNGIFSRFVVDMEVRAAERPPVATASSISAA